MKDILKDLVTHTYSLGFINLVKVTGSKDKATIEAIADDKSVILYGETNHPIKELEGVVGFPNLNKIDLHLKNPEYKENAKINVVWENRNGEDLPVIIHFENEAGDYKNDYKLMLSNLINEKIKKAQFKGSDNWPISFEPTVNNINRLKLQASANSEESSFMVKTDGDVLKVFFGDYNSHEGNFNFHSGITGKLRQAWSYPVAQAISILNLDGDKTVNFSDEGIALFTVDSGIAKYKYYIPAVMK